MPRQVSVEELVSLEATIAGLPGPAAFEEIARQTPLHLPRRTLQRRLAQLVAQGRLTAHSERGGRRSAAAPSPGAVNEAAPAPFVVEPRASITLSPAARAVRQQVRRPVSLRRPLGYRTALLEDYRPNVSAYLSPMIRRKLADMGGADGKKAEEAQMILNHKAAIELLAEEAEEIGFNRYTLCNLHALLSDGLLPDPGACGRLRTGAVAITGTVFHPLEVPQAIEDAFEQILVTASLIEDAFEQAFFAMVHLPYLQPFDDVNKRVSRLAANIPLVRRNTSPLSFVDVPLEDYVGGVLGLYELNRVDYLREVFVWAYERSCARYAAVRQSLGQPDPFRLRLRPVLQQVVAEVVRAGLDKRAAAAFVQRQAQTLPQAADRPRFVILAETELSSLHEGNFARFRLRPAEFQAWRKTWR